MHVADPSVICVDTLHMHTQVCQRSTSTMSLRSAASASMSGVCSSSS